VDILKDIFFIVGIICLLFFLLGLKSQKGKAKGLEKGRLRDVRAAIIATGGTITREQDGYISATYMSKIFKFIDDVEVRDAGAGIIHVRSASRVGFSDRGVNRKRVAMINAALSSTDAA